MEFENKSLDAERGEGDRACPSGSADLSAIADEIESYVGLWLSRLEEVLEGCVVDSPTDTAIDARIAEFEEERRRWNLQRQQEMQQMQETAQQLTAAWARLENEQRRLLQAQETLQSPAAGQSPGASAKANTLRAGTPTAGPVHAQPSGESPSGGEGGAVSRELAVRQFQQLRRQMGMSGETT